MNQHVHKTDGLIRTKSVLVYPFPYLVLTKNEYTKHYYAGADRVAACLGGGEMDLAMTRDDDSYTSSLDPKAVQKVSTVLFEQSMNQVGGRVLEPNDLDCIKEIFKGEFEDVLHNPIDGIPNRMRARVGFKYYDFHKKVEELRHYQHDEGKYVYYYHSDHLGSASWITNHNGDAVQHIQYLPYGEPYVNERPFGYSERFLFTGKERDEETGYGYFGARYMDHEQMTMWLSVDPMADKYPSISPYAYCAWNPVKLKDPDGREINPVFSSTGTFRGCTKEGYTGEIIIYDGKRKFDNLNADKLIQSTSGDTKKAEYYTFSEYRNTMSKKAKEKMYTHIVSQLNGYKVQGSGSLKPFDIGELEGGKIFFGKAPDNTKDGAYISTTGRNRIVATELNLPPLSGAFIGEFYEATVENIQASVVIHEWYGHLQRGWGDANKTHRYCYSAVWNDPLFQKTTEKYQEFIKSQYNYYNRIETNNKKIR